MRYLLVKSTEEERSGNNFLATFAHLEPILETKVFGFHVSLYEIMEKETANELIKMSGNLDVESCSSLPDLAIIRFREESSELSSIEIDNNQFEEERYLPLID